MRAPVGIEPPLASWIGSYDFEFAIGPFLELGFELTEGCERRIGIDLVALLVVGRGREALPLAAAVPVAIPIVAARTTIATAATFAASMAGAVAVLGTPAALIGAAAERALRGSARGRGSFCRLRSLLIAARSGHSALSRNRAIAARTIAAPLITASIAAAIVVATIVIAPVVATR